MESIALIAGSSSKKAPKATDTAVQSINVLSSIVALTFFYAGLISLARR